MGRARQVLLMIVVGIAAAAGAVASAQVPTCLGQPATIVADGSEIVHGTPGPDVIVGTDRKETIRGGGGDDLICAGAGNDDVFGGPGRDRLRGDEGTDEIMGGPGADDIDGGAGGDRLRGEAGNDTIRDGAGRNRLWGGDGHDLLSVDYAGPWVPGEDGTKGLNGGAGDDRLIGGPGPDHLAGGPGRDEIDGGEGSDHITGFDGPDTLRGGDGDDSITGGRGFDELSGGDGDDAFKAGDQNDSVQGGPGSDRLRGGAGHDTLDGQDGADVILGGDGDDVLRGRRGHDRLDGDTGRDRCNGGGGISRFTSCEPVIWSAEGTLGAPVLGPVVMRGGRTGQNPILFCDGHRIQGAGGGVGLLVDGADSPVVVSCRINDWGIGILARRTNGLDVQTTRVVDSATGVRITESDNANVRRAVFERNRVAVEIRDSRFTDVTGGQAIANRRSYVITGKNSWDNGIVASDAGQSTLTGILVTGGSRGTTVSANTIDGSQDGIVLSETVSNRVFDNDTVEYRRFGIRDTTAGDGTAGTSSTYTGNQCWSTHPGGTRASPPGLC